jgi:LuxR family maltose regulon positive regulatory protein
MSTPLLRTKLHVPPIRPQLVPRRYLLERLNAGLTWKLALVCAPAGYGKTTLLSEWIAADGSPAHVAWLSVDEGDNDVRRFLAHVVASLQSIRIGIGEPLPADPHFRPPDDPTALLIPLLNRLLAAESPFALVLDDYHLIQNGEVHKALVVLLDHLPPKMRLVIATRTDPPLRLAQRRARSDLCEIRARDLRFTVDDAARFLNQSMGLALSPSDVATLTAKTEGWIAGLQLAAISLKTHPDKQAFLAAFAGDDRYIVDYLLDEVLAGQPAHIQAFLRQTSILDRFCAPLCDAVTGRDDSQAILETLERENLFLVPLDNQRHWYRYHHLFADLLRVRARRVEGESLTALYGRAGAWYEGQGMISEAVQLALLGDDAERVARLMDGHLLAVVSTGELAVMTRLLAALPKETIRGDPWLALAMAWGMAYEWHLEAVAPLLDTAASALKNLAQDTRRWFGARILVLQSYVAGCRADYSESIRIAQEALTDIPEDDLSLQSFAVLIIGNAHRFRGDLARAIEFHERALSLSRRAGDVVLSVMILARLTDLYRMTGRLRRAYQTGISALEMVDAYQSQTGRPSFILGYLQLRLSGVHYERNDLETALHSARVGLDLAKQWGAYDTISLGYVNLARIYQALGRYREARDCLIEFKGAFPSEGRLQHRIASAVETEIRLQGGDLEGANDWLETCGLDTHAPIPFQELEFYAVLAQVLVAREQLSDAQTLLERLLVVAEESGAVEYEIQMLGRMAVVLRKQGDEVAALDVLARALALAAPEGYQRSFLNGGEPMAQLLYRAALQGVRPEFCRRLLAGFSSVPGPESRSGDGLVDPLSDRELEVLALIAEGMTNQEIAAILVLSLYTIKSHARNIFGKLDVKNRTEAVAKARLLGLLP